MLTRLTLNSGRHPIKSLTRLIQWRCLSTGSQTIPLAYDLHLPPSKARYSQSQPIPAVILLHGVAACHTPSVKIISFLAQKHLFGHFRDDWQKQSRRKYILLTFEITGNQQNKGLFHIHMSSWRT